MPVIDADTHVIESEWTWDYLDPADRHFRPLAVSSSDRDGPPRHLWLVGGQQMRRAKSPDNPYYPRGAQDLTDIPARLADMDRLGVDIQVLFTSFFLMSNIKRPELELALCKSYYRWMSEVSAASHGRLRWVAPLPLLSIQEAAGMLEGAKRGGACGVFMRGTEHDRVLSDPHFFPVYAKAMDLDLPICIHVGNTVTTLNEVVEEETIIFDVFPVPAAMYSLLAGRVPARFPELRFGFLEAGSQWLPFILQETGRGPAVSGRTFSRHQEVLRENRLFVACQTDDDLPYILQFGAAQNLVFGTDYGHVDVGSDLEGHRLIRERTDIPGETAEAIVSDNAARLYGL